MDDGTRVYDIFCFDGIFERRSIDAIVSTKRLRVSLKNMKEVILAIYEFKYTNLQIRTQVPPDVHCTKDTWMAKIRWRAYDG